MNTHPTSKAPGRSQTCDPEHQPAPMRILASGDNDEPGPSHGLLVPVTHMELVGRAFTAMQRAFVQETALSALDLP